MTSKQILRQLRIPDLNSKQLVMFVKRALTDERILKKLKIGDEIEDEMVMVKSRKRFKQMIDDECVMQDEGSSAQSEILNQDQNDDGNNADTRSQILKRVQNDKGGKNDGRVQGDGCGVGANGGQGGSAQSEILNQVQNDGCVKNDCESDKGETHGQILKRVQIDKGGKNDGRVQNDGSGKNDKWVVRHVRRDSIKLRKRVLIKDGKYCYIDYLDQYIKRKRRHLTQAYCDQLLRIKHRQVYADRNETNLRLDSNVTNLKSDFIGPLSIDDQRLTQVDLKNSQFRFFVMLMEQCERQMLFGKTSGEFPMTKFSAVRPSLRASQEAQEKNEALCESVRLYPLRDGQSSECATPSAQAE